MRGWARHLAFATAYVFLGVALSAAAARAKTPGTTYCYRDICRRVKTIPETAADIGKPIHALASYYDAPWRDPFNPRLMTSSGEIFEASGDDTAASPIYPDGTRLLVFAPASGGAAVVRVNNAGPYWSGRSLDVSRGVAEKLGFLRRGLAHVVTLVLSAPTRGEARYEAGRTYPAVPGYLGHFANLSRARAAWDSHPQAMALAALPPPLDGMEDEPASRRVVAIGEGAAPKRHAAAAPRGERVVLKPVKLRRPLVLAALSKRKARVADNARQKPKL